MIREILNSGLFWGTLSVAVITVMNLLFLRYQERQERKANAMAAA